MLRGPALGRRDQSEPSLPEVHRSIEVRASGPFWRRLLAFAGPGYLVAVGYMDPGNWATGVAGGSAFGYSLLWVILLSNCMAMLLQALAARLGIASGRDLAQSCRAHYGPGISATLWLLCELAMCATDLAEVLGTAIALNMLFHLPLAWGVCLTIVDVLAVLCLQQRGFRKLEALTICLISTVLLCFIVNVSVAHPDKAAILRGLLPEPRLLSNPEMLYLAVGIMGATVMPHNLYLHSSIVQTRRYALSSDGRRQAARLATWDVVAALLVALAINAAILVLSAAAFHRAGSPPIHELQLAHHLLSPALGVGFASALFATALLASGQSSAITATLTGQIVMEGFVSLRAPAWLRRLLTRGLAIVPALIATLIYGSSGVGKLLILSQAVLSLQLPFAMVPLIRFTSSRTVMGALAIPYWLRLAAWGAALLIIGLNALMLVQLAL